MIRWRLLGCGLLALVIGCMPVVGSAENLINLPPEMLLLHGQTDLGEVAENASVTVIDPQSLPDKIEEELKAALLSHGVKLDKIGSVAAYAWNSPGLVQRNQPPNYIIDFIKLAPQNGDLPQGQQDLCNSEGCLLLGYTFVAKDKAAGGGIWRRDFEMRSFRTAYVPIKTGNSDNYKVYIQTINNPTDCEDGIAGKDGCHRQFEWRKFGLAIVRSAR